MSLLTVLAPMRLEAWALRTKLLDVRVMAAGLGPSRIRRTAARLDLGDCPAVAVAGFGGAVAANLRPGDVVVATEVCGPDGVVTPCPAFGPLVAALRSRGLTVHAGRIRTVERITTGAARGDIAADGTLAVDMESSYVAAAVGELPFTVLRVITDTPDAELLRPKLVWDGIRAWHALRHCGPALVEWAGAVGPRDVLLADPRSFCAGVERAIDIVERALDRYPIPVYVRKQIVHNAHVVAALEQRGAVFVDELEEVPDGATVVFSAHGVAPAVRAEAARRSLHVVDATCPLVTKVHAEAKRFVGRGDTVVFIGHDGHEESEGTVGEAPGSIRLVEDVDAVARLVVDNPERVSYLMQTTLATDEADRVVAALKERFPNARGPGSDDICYATTNRQNAVRAIARDSDLVLVVGSRNSSNSLRLVEVARREGVPAHLVDDASDVDPAWLAAAGRVGVTAGASAPPALVAEVVGALRGLGPVQVREQSVATETLQFTLPKEVS